MARGKSISVKIATSKVIEALEKSLAEKNAYRDEYKVLKAQYDKDLANWENEVSTKILKVGKPDQVRVSNRYSWSPEKGYEIVATFIVPFDSVPPKPEAPEYISESTIREDIKEMENAVRILKMTDEEVVSTSTYNSIARFL